MAPLIDMVFLLLVFFMCVSSLSQAGSRVPVELAESSEARVAKDLSRRATVTVLADGATYLGAARVEPSQLKPRLEAERRLAPDLRLVVRAERAAPYRLVEPALVAAAEAGVADVIYSTYQR